VLGGNAEVLQLGRVGEWLLLEQGLIRHLTSDLLPFTRVLQVVA
jgi:hypothetical protein